MKWIPIKDKLPNKSGKYFVSTKPHAGHYHYSVEKAWFGINEGIFWQGKLGRSNFQDITKFVTAWMPMIEPYKEEEK